MKGVIFTYLLTMVGMMTSLFYPVVGICIYMLFGVISPTALWYYSLTPTFMNSGMGYSEVVAYPTIVGWVLRHCGNLTVGKAFLPLFLMGFYTIWMIFSAVLNGWSPISQSQVLMFLRLILAMVILLTLCNSVKMLRIYLWILVAGIGFVAFELNMSYIQSFNRLQYVGYAGMDNNFFAVAMVVGTAIAFFLGLSESKIIMKALAFFFALMQAHVVMFSMSRGGMLGLCVIGIATFWVLPKNYGNVFIFLVALGLGLYLCGPSVRDRFVTAFENVEDLDGSAQSRLRSWSRCLVVVKEKPLIGVGLRKWPSYTQARFGTFVEAHSTWFQTGVESGIPALLAQLGFFFFIWSRMRAFFKGKLKHPDPRLKYYAQMVFVAILGYGISAQFVSLYAMELMYYTCTMGLIILKLVALHAEEEREREYQETLEEQQAWEHDGRGEYGMA